MAQQRMNLWAAEEELGGEEIDGGFQDQFALAQAQALYAQQMFGDDGTGAATLLAVQQQMAQQVAFAQIPDDVKKFIVHFHQAVIDNNLQQITNAYEGGWNKLTEKYYAKTEWPEAEIIAPLVGEDQIFLILYRELYYRHVYSRLQPNIDDRFHSYENSCELFNYLLNSAEPVALQLPEQWLWDIIDEFIYQFQSFCVWRSKPKTKTEDELAMLAEGGQQVWSSYSVLNVLYSLIQKSKIEENIAAHRAGKSAEEIEDIVGEYGSKSLYKNLGYFSLIGLLRVHTLLGDFTLALKVLDNVELTQKSTFTRVTACHVTTYYYVGFCYIMLRRYPDAIRTFVAVLNFIMRMRQFHTRSYQYDQINKTADRMYALFAVCTALSPSRLDDNIANVAKERYGEQVAKMSQGEDGLAAFEELFLYACPKFIAANAPPYDDPEALAAYTSSTSTLGGEPSARHLAAFLADVRLRASAPTLRGFLKLYASLSTHKLAGFLDAGEEDMVQQMMALKLGGRSVSRVGAAGTEGGLMDGEMIVTSDLDFVIDDNMVHIVESTVGRRYAGWFIRNTEHAARVLDQIHAMPLPAPMHAGPKGQAPQQQHQQAPPAPAEASAGAPKVAWGGVKVVG